MINCIYGRSSSNNLSGLIESIAVLIGALLPIIVSLLAYMKAHTNSQSIQKVVNTSEQVVDSLEATNNGHWNIKRK
jgi:uncharacterized BrkB/YihY/UPF0761 family membrane protein